MKGDAKIIVEVPAELKHKAKVKYTQERLKNYRELIIKLLELYTAE